MHVNNVGFEPSHVIISGEEDSQGEYPEGHVEDDIEGCYYVHGGGGLVRNLARAALLPLRPRGVGLALRNRLTVTARLAAYGEGDGAGAQSRSVIVHLLVAGEDYLGEDDAGDHDGEEGEEGGQDNAEVGEEVVHARLVGGEGEVVYSPGARPDRLIEVDGLRFGAEEEGEGCLPDLEREMRYKYSGLVVFIIPTHELHQTLALCSSV